MVIIKQINYYKLEMPYVVKKRTVIFWIIPSHVPCFGQWDVNKYDTTSSLKYACMV